MSGNCVTDGLARLSKKAFQHVDAGDGRPSGASSLDMASGGSKD